MQQNVRARYDYDPFGKMTKISGDRDSVFGYTGHLWHAQSGLNLTLFRAYDPNIGRWISRDPIGIAGGLNVYAYVGNSTISKIDPLGLDGLYVWFPQGGAVGHAAVEMGGVYYSLWPRNGSGQVRRGTGPGKWNTPSTDMNDPNNGEGRPADIYVPLDGPNYPDPSELPIPNWPAPPWDSDEHNCSDNSFDLLKKKRKNMKKNKREKRNWKEWAMNQDYPPYYPLDLLSDLLSDLLGADKWK